MNFSRFKLLKVYSTSGSSITYLGSYRRLTFLFGILILIELEAIVLLLSEILL